MRTHVESNGESERKAVLHQMLTHLRDEIYEKIREFRLDQRDDAQAMPADEMDLARSSSDIETHASLIARAEERLRFIDRALVQVEQGGYGVCAECGDEIGIERLAAVPFAVLCVDCQRKTNRARRWGEGTTIRPYDHQWSIPDEMEEPGERAYSKTGPEEEMTVHFDDPFGPEEGEAPPVKRKRGRPRKNPPK